MRALVGDDASGALELANASHGKSLLFIHSVVVEVGTFTTQ